MSRQTEMYKLEEVELESPIEEPVQNKVKKHPSLRMATLEDIPVLLDLSDKLYRGSPIEIVGIDKEKARKSYEHFISNMGKDYLCLMSFVEEDGKEKIVGVLAAYAFEPIFTTDRVACEVVWYLEPEYRKGRRGIEMMKAYEYWAKLVGCKVVQYGWLESSPIGMKKLYEMTGAKKSEEVYYKEL